MDTGYTLKQVLTVAKDHPYYNKDVKYPPSAEDVIRILDTIEKQSDGTSHEDIDLRSFPLTPKDTLYETIQRLTADTSSENTFRHSCYISITGGGSGGMPMMFATDAGENRRHRMAAGVLAKTCGLVEPTDFVMSLHSSGKLYRALDLITEIVENAGGSVLCAGGAMPMPAAKTCAAYYCINAIAGDGSQVLQFANYIASLPAEERVGINIKKVIYTSETLSREQRAVIGSALGQPRILSMLGSAEAGVWGMSNSELTGEPDDEGMDFIFDTRMMNIEILPTSATDGEPVSIIESLPDGETGVIVQTSLSRLRNPLVRYITGDVGNLRPFHCDKTVKNAPSPEDGKYLKVLRLYGRDRRFSFEWSGEYFEFQHVNALISGSESWGVIQWQIVLHTMKSKDTHLEIRLYRSNVDGGESLSDEEIAKELKKYFLVFADNADQFKVTFVSGLDGFERSSTGAKVMRYVEIKNC
ncbi:hypothetical protein TWF696_005535 [Orbilia brochopaga]|uniref:Uncharacterized protein n=1 Tax=Orbilia brochopaga TaxID=3140254 RepID=A0AAV9V2R0_9PEZI